MLIAGLVSVTFRKLSVREVVRAVKEAGLGVIEWGGDVHVPHGEIKRAREVRELCAGAGIGCCSYGSYYRLGDEEFEKVLETGVALGAPVIRVWAGRKGSEEVSEMERRVMVKDARRICEMAQSADVKVAMEFHGKTLTDTNASARKLVEEVGHGNLSMLWQPTPEMSIGERMKGLREMLPVLENVHVYHYTGEGYGPLAEMEEEWRGYLDIVRETGREHCCLLEFVQGDSVEAFLRDARKLREWI